jgi:hypothetical protein
VLRSASSAPPPLSRSQPIWAPLSSNSSRFVLLRGPAFTLPGAASALASARVLVTAAVSPNVAGQGTPQSKLFGSFTLFVNGVPAAVGPGRAAPGSQQAVTALDVAHLLRDAPARNVLAVAAAFSNSFGGKTDPTAAPRVQLELSCVPADGGAAVNVSTAPGAEWLTLEADAFFNPQGDCTAHSPWYHVPNEDLDALARPLGWAEPGYSPPVPAAWRPAALQPPFEQPLYVEAAPPPDMLWRAACSVRQLGARQVVDFGQQLNGGVNLSFVGATGAWPAGTQVGVQLGEELLSDGSVLVPARSSVNYSAVFTLDAAGSANNMWLSPHEFSQFRYAQVIGAPVALTPDTALAWVLQHAGGNPFAAPACARSLPFVAAPAPPAPTPPLTGAFAAFSSSSAALDEVYRFTAFTAVVAGLDENVDSQTRQRDMCNVDAAITNAEQYAVFAAGDYALQRHTARVAFQNLSTRSRRAT